MTSPSRTVGVHEAKTHLSELLRAVEDGETIVLTRSGRAVAELRAASKRARIADSFGKYEGEYTFAPGFEEPDGELADLFERSELFPPATSP